MEVRFSNLGDEKVSFAARCDNAQFGGQTFPAQYRSNAGKFRRSHMTAIHLHSAGTRHPRHAALEALSDATGWVFATLREWRQRSRDRAELATLDHRMLVDIGLTEADQEFLANKPFWRE
jgi:uncharacterized protein YjiS (DUF1127 family)